MDKTTVHTKLTILMLSGWYYPDSLGGTENYVYWLARELVKRGLKVQIAAPSIDEKESNYTHQGIEVYRYPVYLNPSRQEMRSDTLKKYNEIFIKWIKEHKPDLAHIHSFTRGCGINQAEIIKKMGIPLVITAHMSDFICKRGTMMFWGKLDCDGKIKINRCAACYLQKKGVPKFLCWLVLFIPRFIAEKFEKIDSRLGTALSMKSLIFKKKKNLGKLFKMADAVIVVSKWLYNTMVINGFMEDKLFLISHGLPKKQGPIKKSARENNTLTIGYLGRINYVKGVHVLIRAVKKLPRTTEIKLKICGSTYSPEEKSYLERLKREKGADLRIEFLGELMHERKKYFFEMIDILAVPSLWFETGPLVVLEAFFYKTPVLGSDLGGIAELVKDKENGILVEAGNIKRWANAMQDMYLNPAVVQNAAKNIPEVKSFGEVASENLLIYEKVF